MSVPADQIPPVAKQAPDDPPLSTSEPVVGEDINYQQYTYVYKPDNLRPDADLTDKTLFAYMCADILEREKITLTKANFDKLVDEQIATQAASKTPLIDPPMAGDVRLRSQYTDTDHATGKAETYQGYKINISPQLQDEITTLGYNYRYQQMSTEPVLSPEYQKDLDEQRAQAQMMLEKLTAVAEWHQKHNGVHAATQIVGVPMGQAANAAAKLNEALNAERVTLESLKAPMARGNEILEGLSDDWRNRNKDQITAKFDDNLKTFDDQGKVLATVVGVIPVYGKYAKPAVETLLDAHKLWRGDLTADEFKTNLMSIGVDAVTAGKLKGANPGPMKEALAEFAGKVAQNLPKELAAAKAAAVKDGARSSDELNQEAYINAFTKSVAGAVTETTTKLGKGNPAAEVIIGLANGFGIERPLDKQLESEKEKLDDAAKKKPMPVPAPAPAETPTKLQSQALPVRGPDGFTAETTAALRAGVRDALPGKSDDQTETLVNALKAQSIKDGVSLGAEVKIGQAKTGVLVASMGEGLRTSVDPEETLRSRSLQQTESDVRTAIAQNAPDTGKTENKGMSVG